VPVSAVVLSEILIGVRELARHPAVVEALTIGSEILTPTAEDWLAAGRVVSQAGGEDVTKRRSFWNDAIIAAQCARLGLTLITANTPDFRRLSKQMRLSVAAPFPD
jgi:predicted nucleic acid-binding protein